MMIDVKIRLIKKAVFLLTVIRGFLALSSLSIKKEFN